MGTFGSVKKAGYFLTYKKQKERIIRRMKEARKVREVTGLSISKAQLLPRPRIKRDCSGYFPNFAYTQNRLG